MAADPRVANGQVAVERIDEGLRSYMLSVYNYMCLGLGLTGVVAFAAAQSPTVLGLIHGTPLKWVLFAAVIGIAWFGSPRIATMSVSGAQLLFWAFASLFGLMLSYIFVVYTGGSIARAFFMSAAMFGGMSLYGYTTKRDLSGWGSFLMVGLIAAVIASIVNWFIGSTALQFALSVIVLFVAIGLTAYDSQQIKEMYSELDGSDIVAKKAIMGALRLYMDFILIFQNLLYLTGMLEE
ncbi:MAG: Bax inhibitor-1/YccA family protein [Alphaproteobacteria bacterium]|nr:Bax inhibitor-1/YccA family protein [Alphaproteobacteria bacterium]